MNRQKFGFLKMMINKQKLVKKEYKQIYVYKTEPHDIVRTLDCLYKSGIQLIIATDLFSVPSFKEFIRGKRYRGSYAAVKAKIKEFRRLLFFLNGLKERTDIKTYLHLLHTSNSK